MSKPAKRMDRHPALALLAFGAVFFPTGSFAMTLTIPESAIVSLANAPTLLSVDGATDAAGRPFLSLELEFANDCYAATGVAIESAYGPRDRTSLVAVLGQRVPPDGCPDIFQPVQRILRALLPEGIDRVTLLAKPASADVTRLIRIEGPAGALPEPAWVEEVAPPDSVIAPEIDAPVVLTLPEGGYTISGRLHVHAACAEGAAVRATAYEIPDVDGMPSTDAILLTAPAECAPEAGDAIGEVAIRLETPQPPAGRRVLIMNTMSALPLSIAP